jgi:hypothetical protein
MDELTDDELLSELGVEGESRKVGGRSHEEARVIAGFEEITKFAGDNGRAPAHGDDKDIFERLYAVRLDRIRATPTFCQLLAAQDPHGLLQGAPTVTDAMDDDALLAELGIDESASASDITKLTHVKPRAPKRITEEVAVRKPCGDFAKFKPLFLQIQKDLDIGVRETRLFKDTAAIEQGQFFIVSGQIAYVADVGAEFTAQYGRRDCRLRVIFDNGTESDLLLRSLQRALHKDDAGRRVTDPTSGPLFGNTHDEQDTESGTIYVLKSHSAHPKIAANRNVIHKIGVTSGEVAARIANAEHESTCLYASVEIVAEYTLYNINRSKLENLLHRVFAAARLDLQIHDSSGRSVKPREWFLVPLTVIDEAVCRIRDQTITDFTYDPKKAALRKVA